MAAEEKEVKKKSFLVYYDNQVIVRHLTDDEAGKLFKALFPYAADGVKPDFEDNQALAMAFDVLRIAIDRDKEKYIKKCESNRKNIEKRWNKKILSNTNVYIHIQKIPIRIWIRITIGIILILLAVLFVWVLE